MKNYYLTFALLIASEISIAQIYTAADAGVVRKNIEPLKWDVVPELVEVIENKKQNKSHEIRRDFDVKEVKFYGNTLIDDGALLNFIYSTIHVIENIDDLNAVAEKIAAIYAEHGWLVKVILPEQDISEGQVYFNVIESKFAGVRYEGKLPKNVRLDKILKIIHSRQSLGEPLRIDEIDRALLLADDLAGVSVTASFSSGENEGDTVVILRTADEKNYSGQINFDNYGTRGTGLQRGSIGLILNSPNGIGDVLNVSGQYANGGPYFRANYNFPLNADGLRLGVSTSYLTYKLIAPEFNYLKPSGDSSSIGFDLTYAFIRSRNNNINIATAFERKKFNNETIQGRQSKYSTQAASVSLSGYFFDGLWSGGANGYSLTLTSGSIVNAIMSAQTELPDKYKKINYSVTRQQKLNHGLSFFANYMGQRTRQTLDSSERISIGGVNGVRAYPNGEGAADAGDLLSMELRQRLNQEWTISAFYDWGRSKRVLSSPSPYTLHGQGLWINWQSSKGVNAKFIWARRLGAHPYPSQNGKDQDGSFDLNRFWIQIGIPFSG